MLVRISQTLRLEEVIKCIYSPYSLRIVCYHSIATNHPFLPSHLCVSPSNFIEQMRSLKKHFNIISFDDLESVRSKKIVRPLIITFDDGLRDNFDVAFPILREMGISATFYLNTLPLTEGRILWTHHLYILSRTIGISNISRDILKAKDKETIKIDNLPSLFSYVNANYRYEEVLELLEGLGIKLQAQNIYIGKKEIGELLKHGMGIGCHSHTHFNLTKIENAEDEVRLSKDCLESFCQKKIRTFAYPFGDPESFNDTLNKKLGNFFEGICTTLPKVNKQPLNGIYHRVCSYEMPAEKLLLKLLIGI